MGNIIQFQPYGIDKMESNRICGNRKNVIPYPLCIGPYNTEIGIDPHIPEMNRGFTMYPIYRGRRRQFFERVKGLLTGRFLQEPAYSENHDLQKANCELTKVVQSTYLTPNVKDFAKFLFPELVFLNLFVHPLGISYVGGAIPIKITERISEYFPLQMEYSLPEIFSFAYPTLTNIRITDDSIEFLARGSEWMTAPGLEHILIGRIPINFFQDTAVSLQLTSSEIRKALTGVARTD